MSFIRIIYNMLMPHKISFTLTDIPKIMDFARDLTDGKYVEKIEKHEFEKFLILACRIDEKADLLPAFKDLLAGKKGKDVKEALFQHRVLVHSLFFSQGHVINQLVKMINEMESQVRMMENESSQGYKVIAEPQVGGALERINGSRR